MNTKSQTTPRFSDVFAEAERLAAQFQEYELADFIASDGLERDALAAVMSERDAERYERVMDAAFTKLDAK